MPSDIEQVKAQSVQRAASKRATLEGLRAKKRKSSELELVIDGEVTTFALRANGAREYDRLITENPPNLEQRAQGQTYNLNTFAPALLAQVVIDPSLTPEQWGEIWGSPDWNRGELMTFFSEAVELCNKGLDLGPTARG